MKKLIMGLTVAGILVANPIIGKAALGDQTLKYGMSHSDVKQLQQKLKSKGYYTYSKNTTYFGTYTRDAVKRLQKAKGLKADGIVGKNTFKALGLGNAPNSPRIATQNTSALISTAKKYIGVQYVWGGQSPKGFDCSGYLNYVYQKSSNIDLPRTVAGIYLKGTKISAPKVGDLVFFETYKPGASHAGIYLGNNEFIHSSSSRGVSISSMKNPYWAPRYLGAKKLN
ncbi:C40 family peptidase [Fictibacillus sp. S7]|uniref:C40 family peptidase n=1 Tax=Fictibacillus sp. S7 TaxID=2212476 RepID=UPI001010E169|nr:NlpC/P60 family protein [Fictibacillus sp. S7]RXZ02167.1 endopeptidase [Fictibacillus sp. S7]